MGVGHARAHGRPLADMSTSIAVRLGGVFRSPRHSGGLFAGVDLTFAVDDFRWDRSIRGGLD